MSPNSTPTLQRHEHLNDAENSNSSPSSTDLSVSTEYGLIYRTALETAEFVVHKTLGQRTHKNKYGDKMFGLTTDMLKKHGLVFNSKKIEERLKLSPSNVEETFRAVTKYTFQDGVNFGRIVSLFTFCIVVSEYCAENNMEDKVKHITKITADTVNDLKDWFECQGGWDGFLNHFTDPSEKVWKGLMWTTVGLGAVATFLYVKS